MYTLHAVILASAFAALVCAVTHSDFRVCPGFGDRSGTSVRVTFATKESDPRDSAFESAFSYNAQFRYRWTNLRTHTSLFPVQAGVATAVAISNAPTINFTLPKAGAGVRGLMTADICFASEVATCEVGEHDDILAHLPTLLNAVVAKSNINFWTLLGDNFYDGTGATSQQFWATLSQKTKSTLFLTAPGNYDFWSSGDPTDVSVKVDQFGNGYMQYFGADTLSAAKVSTGNPWNFSVNPDTLAKPLKKKRLRAMNTPQPNQRYLADASNFEYYTQIGNLGFISYSGAHHVDAITAFMQEACQWMTDHDDTIDWIILPGHWAKATKGADENTMVPAVYETLVTKAGCAAKKVKYFEGHQHCNMVVAKDVGFNVGAFGKTSSKCSQFGIPYMDSTNGRLLVVYFPISEQLVPKDTDTPAMIAQELKGANLRYTQLLACVESKAIYDCFDLEHEVWLNETKA